jgi:hypothetical protein
MNAITNSTPWHTSALQKFYSLDAQVAGLRSGLNAANERLGNLSRGITEAENERDRMNEHVAATPVLRGQEAARNRGIDHVKELGVEIERMQSVRAEAIRNRDALAARLARLGPLADRCARMLVALKLLSAKEIAQ